MSHQCVEKAPRLALFRKHGAPVDEGYTHAHLRPREKGRNSPEPEHTHTVSPSVCEPPHPGLFCSFTGGELQCAWSGRVLAWTLRRRSLAGLGLVRPGQSPACSLCQSEFQSWCTMLSVWLTDTGPSWRRRCHWNVVLRDPTSSSSFSCSLANSIKTFRTEKRKMLH